MKCFEFVRKQFQFCRFKKTGYEKNTDRHKI